MRNISFAEKEFYHIYNRGVDKRDVFLDTHDLDRFFKSLDEFNNLNPIGSLHESSFARLGSRASKSDKKPLVHFVAYCVNPNHYHFLIEQVSEKGIEKFMHRLGTGYTKYFNTRYKRTGALFQGKFKAIHVDSNEYLVHLSAYINLNKEVHALGSRASKSSWDEYLEPSTPSLCLNKKIILDQFDNPIEYKRFAEESLKDIIRRKELLRELEANLEAELPNV